ncbi:MAG: hypothetical protein HY000_37955 [Planctomycetes bacterium]|nr:hypothetical protein [Planctomycetia bacterium]MBI3468824.1 hypothetical protein [Planctomycetota bacterium]
MKVRAVAVLAQQFTGALTPYLLCLVLLVLGVRIAAQGVLAPKLDHELPVASESRPLEPVARWDGDWYLAAAIKGYNYKGNEASSVAFFPLFVVLIAVCWQKCGFDPAWSAIGISNVALAGVFVLLWSYSGHRSRDTASAATSWSLLALATFPTTFFFGAAYAESLFVFFAVLVLLGIRRNWHLLPLAILAGVCTASRPVGVAVALPLAWHVWQTSPTAARAAARLAWVVPLSLWGILAYMLFLHIEFGDALAFVHTQDHWRRLPDVGLFGKIGILASAEPIWSHYVPGSSGYWARFDELPAWQSIEFANPIIFVGAAALIALGWAKRWLTVYETLFGALVLFIPYVTRSYEMAMAGHGRFAAAAFPIYLVLGQILARVHWSIAVLIVAVFAFFRVMYTALFAAGYPVL